MNDILCEAITTDKEVRQAIRLVEENSSGKIYLVGGYVFRTIAEKWYDTHPERTDIDIIVENLAAQIALSERRKAEGWNVRTNSFGHPKFFCQNLVVDCWPLSETSQIKRKEQTSTLRNYLSGTPLTVQSIVYDLLEEVVIGEVGMRALLEKTVRVNDLEQAQLAAQRKDMTLEQYVRWKAKGIGFAPILV